MMTLNSSHANPNQRSQFISSIASAPRAPASPEILDATDMTLYSKNPRSTVSGTSSYYSKAAHADFSTGGIRMSGCFSQKTSATGCPVFVQTPSGRRPPPPLGWWPKGMPATYFLAAMCYGSYTPGNSLPLPYANTSLTRPACMPLSHRESLQLILARIPLALLLARILFKTSWAKTRGLFKFHFRLITPRHSADRTAVNRVPHLHWGRVVPAS